MDDLSIEGGDDIDALNDETFGCDIGDINDDWEEEHEKFVGTTSSSSIHDNEKSSAFIDTGSIVHCETSKNFYDDIYANRNTNRSATDELLFPNCEDLIAKNLLDVVSDDNDFLCNDGLSSPFLLNDYIEYDDGDEDDNVINDNEDGMFSNGITYSKSNLQKSSDSSQNRLSSTIAASELSSSSKKKNKAINIDLDSLRPPSPSILPFDHTIMSSVWRPPSPPSQPISSSVQTDSPTKKNASTPSRSDLNILRSPIIRAEDLEADLSRKTDSLKSSTPNRQSSSLQSSAQIPLSMIAGNDYQKMPSFMNLIALSQSQQPNAATIPSPSLSMKTIQPPPGFNNTNNNNNNRIHPYMLMNMTDAQNNDKSSPSLQQQSPSRSATTDPRLLNSPQHMLSVLVAQQQMFLQMQRQQQQQQSQPMKIRHPIPSNVIDPILLQQQRSIINKCIITPAQAQKPYHHHNNNNNNNQNNYHHHNQHHHYHQHHHHNFQLNRNYQDKFAGFMTQREKEWLLKVFRLQCKVNDPYVEDYYEVNYMLKKNAHKFIQKQKELINVTSSNGHLDGRNNVDDLHKIDLNDDHKNEQQQQDSQQESILVLPQMAIPSAEENRPKYIQFDNALGKIQVLNSKCPRKLVELNETEPSIFVKYQLDLKSQYLLKIERLYEHLLNIEDEDKRMPILPDDVKQQHYNHRTELCKKLFNGLVIKIDNIKKDESQHFILINRLLLTLKRISLKVDDELLAIKKGFYLILRSLEHLEDEQQLLILLMSILKCENFDKLICYDGENANFKLFNILIKAIGRIKMAKSLIYLVSSIDDAKIFINDNDNKNGLRLLVCLFKQYEHADDKLLFIYFWKLFVQTLMKTIPETDESYQTCRIHLNYLQQL